MQENTAREVLATRAKAGTGDRLAEMAARYGCENKGQLAALVLERFVEADRLPVKAEAIAVPATYDHSVPAYARNSGTSYEAARSIDAGAIRSTVLGFIAKQGAKGATCDEVEVERKRRESEDAATDWPKMSDAQLATIRDAKIGAINRMSHEINRLRNEVGQITTEIDRRLKGPAPEAVAEESQA